MTISDLYKKDILELQDDEENKNMFKYNKQLKI